MGEVLVALIGVMLAGLCALLAVWYVQDMLAVLRAPALGTLPAPPADGPLVSVIIPARDEAARIGGCLAGLAAQTYRRFEVLVVDDHSSDGTAEVARGYAASLPELRVLEGAPLPPGWAGKCWACWQAAGQARGELLLFLDADVKPRPGLLAAMGARAEGGRIDLLTLVPLIELGSLAERLVLPAFSALLAAVYPFARVNNPHAPEFFAIGQCIMMRRAAYDSVGGHRAVRGSVLEDMDLARLVKRGGMCLEALVAPDLIVVRMYTGWRDLAEGLRKNAVAGFRSGGPRAAWVGVRLMLMAVLPLDLLAAGAGLTAARSGGWLGPALLAAGALLLAVSWLCWGVAVRHRHRIGAAWGALLPLGAAAYFWLAATALVRLKSGRGVRWKGRVFTR
jgi:GT2 family glycosyltransferase